MKIKNVYIYYLIHNYNSIIIAIMSTSHNVSSHSEDFTVSKHNYINIYWYSGVTFVSKFNRTVICELCSIYTYNLINVYKLTVSFHQCLY